MANLQQNLKEILYQDDTVRITKDQITILKYYFPIPAAKTINMMDVVAIHLRDNVDGQMWGTSPGHMDTWFALDSQRQNKKQYLQIVVRDSDVKVAFSPSDPKKVMAIIQTQATLNLAQKQTKFGYGQPAKNIPPIQQAKEVEVSQGKNQWQKPTITQWDKPIDSEFQKSKEFATVHETKPGKVQQVKVVHEKKPQKGVLESIGEKINEKIEGVKNIGTAVKQKYKEGKENAYVSPDNKVDQAKEKVKQSTGQKAEQTGEILEQKGYQMQKQTKQTFL